jgi:hypothetical protein
LRPFCCRFEGTGSALVICIYSINTGGGAKLQGKFYFTINREV